MCCDINSSPSALLNRREALSDFACTARRLQLVVASLQPISTGRTHRHQPMVGAPPESGPDPWSRLQSDVRLCTSQSDAAFLSYKNAAYVGCVCVSASQAVKTDFSVDIRAAPPAEAEGVELQPFCKDPRFICK